VADPLLISYPVSEFPSKSDTIPFSFDLFGFPQAVTIGKMPDNRKPNNNPGMFLFRSHFYFHSSEGTFFTVDFTPLVLKVKKIIKIGLYFHIILNLKSIFKDNLY
jgi:hypothetical protein